MKKYTQKIDAIQFDGSFESLKKIITEFDINNQVLIRSYRDSVISSIVINYWESDTDEGGIALYKNDYLVRDSAGSFSKYSQSVFEKLFK